MRTLKLPLFAGLLVVLLSTNPAVRGDALVNPDEMENRDRWVQWELLSFDKPVVSFLGGAPAGLAPVDPVHSGPLGRADPVSNDVDGSGDWS